MPSTDGEVGSNPETSCPICLGNFRTASGFDTRAAEQGKMRNEIPLKLQCGHVFGRTCLHNLIKGSEQIISNCPLCRHEIHTCMLPNTVLFPRSGEHPDTLALLCVAIRLYLNLGPDTVPETHAGLNNWVHSQLGEEQSDEEELGEEQLGEEQVCEELLGEDWLSGSRFFWIKLAVEAWERLGENQLWINGLQSVRSALAGLGLKL